MSEVVQALRTAVEERGAQGEGAVVVAVATPAESASPVAARVSGSQTDISNAPRYDGQLTDDSASSTHGGDGSGWTGDAREARQQTKSSSALSCGLSSSQANHLSCPSCSGAIAKGGGSNSSDHTRHSCGGEAVVFAESEAEPLFHPTTGDRVTGRGTAGHEDSTVFDLLRRFSVGGAAADVAVSMGVFETAGGRERMEDRHFMLTWGPGSGGSEAAISYSAYSSPPHAPAELPVALTGAATAVTEGSNAMSEVADMNIAAPAAGAADAVANSARTLPVGGSSDVDMFSRLPAGKVHLCGVFDGHRGGCQATPSLSLLTG